MSEKKRLEFKDGREKNNLEDPDIIRYYRRVYTAERLNNVI
jgi:hypothetical protein